MKLLYYFCIHYHTFTILTQHSRLDVACTNYHVAPVFQLTSVIFLGFVIDVYKIVPSYHYQFSQNTHNIYPVDYPCFP